MSILGFYVIETKKESDNEIFSLKKQLEERHKVALKTIKGGLGLTDEEYQTYFKHFC